MRGRYQVTRFLGEGGKKRVYAAHDTKLDRDVAFALIKIDGLDSDGLTRIRREAQAMGRLGEHPHIVAVYDIGDDSTETGQPQPYLVTQLMGGGDLEALIDQAPDRRIPLEDALQIADQICQALEHAHRHGVVHRDLKPGNVWLSEAIPLPEGERVALVPLPLGEAPPQADRPAGPRTGEGWTPIVKLGDFGLAIALDRSRLTQAGMMVGTVSYMAPEQALGSEVTARSDLYSLGCLLYELVTGRPPFGGDESVAIITQHLNTPPVAPSWHRPDLPPGLEVLILRLLEKDPAKRPASASEVRVTLQSGHPHPSPLPEGEGTGSAPLPLGEAPPQADRPAGPRTGEGAPQDPIYRRTFVGREAELKQLQRAFDAALSGQGSLAMVVGEPGIGKTALCEQIATYAAVRGGKTLVGHSYEEGSLSIPYLPFVEALRTYVLSRDPERLKSELGSGAAEVARIISEIRDRVPVELRPPGDPEDDRWRLLQAVAGFLRNASNVQPLLIVLEDLHWADRGTIDLLLHLARNLEGTRVLFIGNYRDVEIDRTHPLSGALAELRRIATFERILLRGLTVDEVHRMMNNIRGQEVPWSRAEAIHRQTEGNPLFVQEVLRYLVEEGLVVREDGRYARTDGTDPAGGIPEGLRDVIGKRLSRLSPDCNRLLTVAAVIGREFSLEVLEKVARAQEDAMLIALEEGLKVGILDEQQRVGGVLYRFSHAMFRQTLYEELSAARRIRLHQEVGRALEDLYSPGDRPGEDHGDPVTRPAARTAGRLDDHAPELAEHFSYSSDPNDLGKAVEYGQRAAARALSVYAYGEALRLLAKAIEVQEVLDPDDKGRRCDLLVALGEALMPAGEPQRVFEEVAEEALVLAEALDDEVRASIACQIALRALNRYAISQRQPRGPLRTWTERADRYAPPGTVDRVYADTSRISFFGGTGEERHQLRLRALGLARQLDDHPAYFFAARPFITMPEAPKYHSERLPIIEEVLQRPRRGVNAGALAGTLYSSGFLLFGAGQRARAEELWHELVELGERTQDPYAIIYARAHEVHRAYFDGDFEVALEKRAHLVARADELGSRGLARPFTDYVGFRALLHLGRLAEAQALDEEIGSAQVDRMALLGRQAEVEAAIKEDVAGIDLEEAMGIGLLFNLEAAVLVGDRVSAEAIVPWLAPSADLALEYQNFPVAPGRVLGAAAAMLGRPGEARTYYQRALAVCEKVRFRPEIALIRLQLAELLLDDTARDQLSAVSSREKTPTADDLKADGLAHLDFAIEELRAMKMQPALEQALLVRQRAASA